MDWKLGVLGIIALCVLGGVLIVQSSPQEPGNPFVPNPDNTIVFKKIPTFKNYNELAAAFNEARNNSRYGILEKAMRGIVPTMAINQAVDTSGSTDYSRTNVQVAGVDEADIVKSDGKYIYNFSSNKLIITDAYPIENSRIVSATDLNNLQPQEMFVEGSKLLLFGYKYEGYDGPFYAEKASVSRYPYWRSNLTVARLYDITDKSNPVLEKELAFEGSYLTSRLVGKNAFFVINTWPNYYALEGKEPENIVPMMIEDGVEKRIAVPQEIGYIAPMPAQNFVTLVSMNLDNAEIQKQTIVGNSDNVFASENNIYLAATVWLPPEGVPVVKDIQRIVVGDNETTVINKFSIQNGKIGFLGQGNVPGHVLNQFSMDEYNENFRIATTIGHVSRGGSESTSNVYVLGKDMKTIGKLEDLAPGEQIYSARFMGNRAYLVTFKKVDPLFVIDVSNPSEPKVLGKLKIPGFSDYLHPIDETHIIGVGKETIESTYGDFAWYQGMKLAIFDVSDVTNPIEMHKIIIGDRGTDSYALRDHKAFLFDRQKELLVLPIMLAEIPAGQKKPMGDEQQSPTYGEPVFQGAFIYKVNLSDGFVERGRITHVSPEDELKRGYYYGDEYSVKRALYIGNVLYTLSDKMLKANALDTLQDLKEFSFQ